MADGILRTDTILDKIINHKRDEVQAAQQIRSLADLQAACHTIPPARDFLAALTTSDKVALIAEVKHASPSKGVLITPFDPLAIAQDYIEGGAAALSILTDEVFFQGHLDILRQVHGAIGVPLLRKEFIISPYQVYEARASHADGVLLIVAALEQGLLTELHSLIVALGMVPLVEVHNEAELERAIALAPKLIGINNRDLHTFSVDLTTTPRLAAHIPAHIPLVGESGIRTGDDIRALGRVDAVLVGETLVTAHDRLAILRELSSVEKQEHAT